VTVTGERDGTGRAAVDESPVRPGPTGRLDHHVDPPAAVGVRRPTTLLAPRSWDVLSWESFASPGWLAGREPSASEGTVRSR